MNEPVTLQSLLLFLSYSLSEHQRQLLAMSLCDDQCRRLTASLTIIDSKKLWHRYFYLIAIYRRCVVTLNDLALSKAAYDETSAIHVVRKRLRKIQVFKTLKILICKKIVSLQKKFVHNKFIFDELFSIKFIDTNLT